MDTTRYLKGLYTIGKLTEFNDGETIAFFLSPEGQDLIRETFVEHAKLSNEADLKDGGSGTAHDGEEAFARLSDIVKFKMEKLVEAVEEEIEVEKLTKVQELNQQRNQQHTAGTTAEIAAKLGVSKSQVRRLKSQGALDAELAKLEDKA